MTVQTRPPEPLPEVSWSEFAARFDPSVHDTLRHKALEPGTEGLLLMECVDLSSSRLGEVAALVYGPARTYAAADLHLGRLVSAGGTLMFSMKCRVHRSNIEMPTQPGQTLTVAQADLLANADAADKPVARLDRAYAYPPDDTTLDGETARAWPVLYKRTTGGKTQEWQIWVERLKSTGHGRIHTRYGLTEGKKQEQQDVVEAGKNAGKKNETSAYRQACLEAAAEWKKQLDRKGYGRTVERSAAVRGASPMLAQKIQDVKPAAIDWATAHAQPKLDGFRCLATKRDGVVTLRSRENRPIDTLPHLVALLTPHVPEGVTLDGELYVHGMLFRKFSSLIKRHQPDSARVEYRVYDALLPDPYHLRLNFIRTVVNEVRHPLVLAVPTARVADRAALDAYQVARIEEGYEGAMLRHGPAGYEAGKRSWSLVKVKTFDDAEFKVLRVREGRGTHKGMAVFTCETPRGAPFDVTAPGSHWEKRQYWLNSGRCVGALLTVKYQGYTGTDAASVPRFPTAMRFNDEPFEMPAEPADAPAEGPPPTT
jgi:DNA ligase-1